MKFRLFTDMEFGAGVARLLPQRLIERGFSRVGLIVDEGVSRNPHLQEVESLLNCEGLVHQKLVSKIMEPSFTEVDEIVGEFRDASIESVVVCGGGSAIDIAKGVSVLLTNPGPAISYRGYGLIKNPGLPLAVLPSTAGSGSEITPNASYVDTSENRKLGINTTHYLPKFVLLDPLLTVSCPPRPSASSGLDALVHAIESFTARSATPIARLFAKEAFRLVYSSLPAVLDDPSDVSRRGDVLLGSFYAGVALMNSASGPAGVLSYPLGVHYKVPHGFAGAIFLAPVARFNLERGYEGYSELQVSVMESPSAKRDPMAFAEDLQAFCRRCFTPDSLTAWGVEKSSLPGLASESFRNRTKSAQENPISIDEKGLLTILEMSM